MLVGRGPCTVIKKAMRWSSIAALAVFFGCGLLNNDELLSNQFGRIDYYLVAYRDSLHLMIYSSAGLTLNYRIRGVRGKFINGGTLYFLMPMTDTVTMTWYNGVGDSLTVPLRMNATVFDSLPIENDTVAKVFHPGYTTRDYYVSVEWSLYPDTVQNGGWKHCRDSTGAPRVQNDTLISFQQKIFTEPATDCRLGLVELVPFSSDTVNYAIINRKYSSEFHFKYGGKCGGATNCKILE